MKTVADFYNKTATGWSDEWYKEKKQNEILGKFYNCYAQAGTKHPRILDLGCGAGYDSKILSRMGARVVGLDISQKLVKIAKMSELVDKHINACSLQKLLTAGGSYFVGYLIAYNKGTLVSHVLYIAGKRFQCAGAYFNGLDGHIMGPAAVTFKGEVQVFINALGSIVHFHC